MNHSVDVTPVVGLLEAVQQGHYSLSEALNELVDNSIDAGATSIHTEWTGDAAFGYKTVSVTDNGSGMVRKADWSPTCGFGNLDAAFRLGEGSKRSGLGGLLGKYGIGLMHGGLALADRIVIITKTEDGTYLTGIFDVNEVKEVGKWQAEIRPSNDEEIILLDKNLSFFDIADSGTSVILTQLTRLDKYAEGYLREELTEGQGTTYSFFLLGKKISVEKQYLEDIDPITLYIQKIKVRPLDRLQIYPGKTVFDTTKTGSIKALKNVRVTVFCPENPKSREEEVKRGWLKANAGFTVVRNNRIIMNVAKPNYLFRKADKKVKGISERDTMPRAFHGYIVFTENEDTVLDLKATKNGIHFTPNIAESIWADKNFVNAVKVLNVEWADNGHKKSSMVQLRNEFKEAFDVLYRESPSKAEIGLHFLQLFPDITTRKMLIQLASLQSEEKEVTVVKKDANPSILSTLLS